MPETPITFACGPLRLEGSVSIPTSPGHAVAVCHPHPEYGGSMDDGIVTTVAHSLQKAGIATLCFNFRGVGRSEGRHGGGVGEVDDVRAALDWLAEHAPEWTWATDYPPSEIDPAEEIIAVTREAAAAIGIDAIGEGIDTTYDGALLTRLAGVPSPAFGPGDLSRAHAPDEWVGIDELVLGARAYARAISAWCGVAAGSA